MNGALGDLPLAFRFAKRELRSGLSGFRIFLASLTLGVAAIAGVGSLGQALLTGLSEQGSALLGGDVEMERRYRPAADDERAFMEKYGRVSETATMRAIAQTDETRTLIELKGVDAIYPLIGAMTLQPAISLKDALNCEANVCGAAVEETLLSRLKRKIGDNVRIGSQDFQLRATIVSEPDRVAGGFTLGPHVLVSDDGLERAGLVTEGSLIEYHYRIAFPEGVRENQTTLQSFRDAEAVAFPNADWDVNDRDNAVPSVRRFVRQATMFLTLVGLTALIVGGVGAGQAVGAFIEKRRATIATLKAIGAEGPLILLTYLLQVMMVAGLGVVLGLLLGALLPFGVEHYFGTEIPAPAHYAVYPKPLLIGAIFGILSALGFAILPLARAREIKPAGLFRDLVAPEAKQGRWLYRGIAYGSFAAIAILSIALSPYPWFNLYFLGGTAVILGVLRLVSLLLSRMLLRIPHRHHQILRLAFANLTRPGSPSRDVMVALGLGLTLLATVTVTRESVNAEVANQLPSRAPSFFFVDIQQNDIDAFQTLVRNWSSAQDFQVMPMMRGRIVKVKGVPSAELQVRGQARGRLNGDRGITYASEKPAKEKMVQGDWWPKDYSGPTLVSFDAEFARDLGLKIGDAITVNLLGREFDAKIANLREIDLMSGGINFFMIFSPGFIDKAPHTYLATVRMDTDQEEPLFQAVSQKFPNITTIRVKEALAEASTMLQKLAEAISAATMITILAGILVLAGAIAAGHRARLYEAVILKVLGAPRARLAAVYAIEYGLLGALAGLAAFASGSIAGWAVARFVLNIDFVFDINAMVLTIAGGAAVTLILGLAGGFAALSAKPAARLRNA